MTAPRDFTAELTAARAANDWEAHARIWEERRIASVETDEQTIKPNTTAVVVVTIHAGLSSRAVFGPFANGDEASKWGFENFPNNTAPSGHSVTWCCEYLIPQADNVFDAIVSSID